MSDTESTIVCGMLSNSYWGSGNMVMHGNIFGMNGREIDNIDLDDRTCAVKTNYSTRAAYKI